jgi:two-component system sensor histidine kinase GlrK
LVILADRGLFENYALRRAQFLANVERLAGLPFGGEERAVLAPLIEGEAEIHGVLSNPEASQIQLVKAVEGFVALTEQARGILARSNEMIDREVETMRLTAAQTQRIILWQMLALVPVMAFLVVGFIVLIARPIRQIDEAIRRLGAGEFTVPVAVGGPQDLQDLGARLEWTRGRLLWLEEQKNRFLRQVSHELKTPLTAVREGAELLNEEVGGKLSPEQREIAEIIRHKSIELQKLIEDLLSYAGSQFHKSALATGPVSVKAVFGRVAENQKLALRAKGVRLDMNAADVTVTADAEKLRVILDNLLSNAIRFSPEGGTVRASAQTANGCLDLEVADEGPGVAPEDRERMFDPFYQGRHNAEGLVGGTGIGLSVVREYAQAHGGSVELVHEPGTRGARLRVRLPLAHAGEAR